jgi:predicted transcriptional regulator
MGNSKNVNDILKKIFSSPDLIEIICSLYEREMTLPQIAGQLDYEVSTLINQIQLLKKYKLLRSVNRNGVEYYMSANQKVCDSLINLKDALYNSIEDND